MICFIKIHLKNKALCSTKWFKFSVLHRGGMSGNTKLTLLFSQLVAMSRPLASLYYNTHSISALCNNIYAAIEFNETAIRAESSNPVTSAYLTDRRLHERNK
ncbi:hypothetical protein HI914_01603 [Erysiphe necator]|nr:hypothetical protein HI914_01603 [Erysiphe necator]